MEWHNTNHLETTILQAGHGLGHWDVYHSPGAGQGVVQVLFGQTPNPPPVIDQILRVHAVTRVITDKLKKTDYYLITITDPRFWDQVKADVQGIIVREQQQEK